MPTLADTGHKGAGQGIHVPVRHHRGGKNAGLDISNRAYNTILRSLRCLGERGFALLTQRWRTLQYITASPGRVTRIARAALVLVHSEHGYLKTPRHQFL